MVREDKPLEFYGPVRHSHSSSRRCSQRSYRYRDRRSPSPRGRDRDRDRRSLRDLSPYSYCSRFIRYSHRSRSDSDKSYRDRRSPSPYTYYRRLREAELTIAEQMEQMGKIELMEETELVEEDTAFMFSLLIRRQREAEMNLMEEETANRFIVDKDEEAIKKSLREILNSDDVKLKIQKHLAAAQHEKKEKEFVVVDARQIEKQAQKIKEELEWLAEEKWRVEEIQRREADELEEVNDESVVHKTASVCDVEDGVPHFDTPQYHATMQQVMQNFRFMSMAERLGSALVQDPSMSQMLKCLSNPTQMERLEERMARIKEDPSLKHILQETQTGGPTAMMRFWDDKDVVTQWASRLQEILLLSLEILEEMKRNK